MPRPRSSSSRRRGPAGPSKVEQRRQAATVFQPVLGVVEPLARRLTQQLPLDVPNGYPLVDSTDREFVLYLAPEWSWTVRARFRDADETVLEVRSDEAGQEQLAELPLGDAAALEPQLAALLNAFAERARSADLRSRSGVGE